MMSTILIVEDEPHMRRVTELSLRKGGYELMIACNGREALEQVERHRPDLIVMDIVMPELDGLGALRQLRSQAATAALPVIMLTVRGHTVTREQAELAGASLFITKPFSPSHLLKEVRRLLGESAS